jgi:hypothetical protein
MALQESESLAQLSKKVDHLFFGLKLISFIFLLVASLGAIYGAFSIPHFQQIYEDALPGKPLPGMTLAVVWAHKFLVITSFMFPLIGLVALFLRRMRISITLLAIALGLAFIQASVVVTALNLPMQEIVEGFSDGSK